MAKEEKFPSNKPIIEALNETIEAYETITALKQKVTDRTVGTKIQGKLQGKSQFKEGEDAVSKIKEAISISNDEQKAIKGALEDVQVAREQYKDGIKTELKKLDEARVKKEVTQWSGEKHTELADTEENAERRKELTAPLTKLNEIESELKTLSKQSKKIVDKDIEATKKELKKELKTTKEALDSKDKNSYSTDDVEKKNNLEKDISAITKISVKRKAKDIGHKLANSGIAKEIKEGVKEIKQKVKQAFTR